MFESFALRPLWKVLKGHLRDLVEQQPKKKFEKVLHASLPQAVDDLAGVIVNTLTEDGAEVWLTDRISLADEPKKPLLKLQTIPLSQLTESQLLTFEMSEKLLSYGSLEQAKSQVGYSEEEWESVLGHYSEHFVRHGTRFALERLIKRQTVFAHNCIVLTLSDSEEYPLGDEATNHDMIKIYTLPSLNDDTSPSVKEVRKIWLNRFKPNYLYEKNVVAEVESDEEQSSAENDDSDEPAQENNEDQGHTFEA